MLEYLEHPQVLADLYRMGSDNLRGVPQSEEPGNQQERLVTIGWVIGFVDGEGCFSIGFTGSSKSRSAYYAAVVFRSWPCLHKDGARQSPREHARVRGPP